MNNDYNKTISGSSGVNFDGITIGGGITPYNNTIDTNRTHTSPNVQSNNTTTLDLDCFITDNLDETVTEKTVNKGTGSIKLIDNLNELDLSKFSDYIVIYNQRISTCENEIKELQEELNTLISVAKNWYYLHPSSDIDQDNPSELLDYYFKSNASVYKSYEYYISEIQKLNEDIKMLNTNTNILISHYASQKGLTIESAKQELMNSNTLPLQYMSIEERSEYLNNLLSEQKQIYEDYKDEYNYKYENGVVFLNEKEENDFNSLMIYLQALGVFGRVGIEPHHVYELNHERGLIDENIINLITYCENVYLTTDDAKYIDKNYPGLGEFLLEEGGKLNLIECISWYLNDISKNRAPWEAFEDSYLAAYCSMRSNSYVSSYDFDTNMSLYTEGNENFNNSQDLIDVLYGENGVLARAHEKQQMEQDLLQMQITIYNLEQAAKLLPYEAVADNQDFEIAEDYSSYTHIADKSLIKDQFLTNREIAIYDYLYQRNPSDAYAYLEALQDTINRRKGMQQAEEFIKNLDGNALDYLIASWEGFKDGNINFVDGCIDYFTADGVVSDFEYAMMYKTMILSAEDNEYTKNLSAEHKYFLSQCYSVMQSTGNMTIPVLLSVVNPKLGSGAMALFSAGNATEQAIQNGTPTYKAYLYGTALGVSEAFTEKYAGGIPGLSDIDDLIVYNMVKEGAQEAGQTWIDAGFKRFILGEEINVNSTTVESMTAAYQGFWVSGIFQGPNIYRNIKTTVQPKLMETGATLGHLKIAETPSVDMANNNVSNIESTSTSNSSNIDGTIETLYSTDESNAQANDALTNNDSEGLLNALANNDSEGLLNALANMSLDNRIEFVRTLSDTNQINTTLQLFTELEVEQLAGTLGAEYSARGININEFLNLPTEIQSEILLRTNPNMVTEAYPTLIKNIDFVDMDVLDSLYKILPPNYKATMLTDILTTNDIRNEFYSKGKLGDISIETLQQYEAAINAEVIQSWNLSNHIDDYFKNDKTYNSLSQEKQQKLREVTMESLELAIFVYEHNISTATMTISQMISQRDYYNVPIDQVLQEKIKAKTIKGYKIPQKQIIINGNNYTSYFPSMDYYISDSRVLSYMKAITNDPGVQACNSLQEMGSYLKSRTSMGKPVTIDVVTFQTTRIGSANFERFNAFGIAYIENGNPQYGGMFTFSINDLEKMATNYSQYCKYEDGKFTILDYKNFGSKVLGGVPLSNDGGVFMITTNIPINNSNLALPSVMNERAYLVDNIPGGNLPETSSGYKPTEITIKGNKLTENQTDGVLWGIAENDVGVIEINGMTYSVQELRKEK